MPHASGSPRAASQDDGPDPDETPPDAGEEVEGPPPAGVAGKEVAPDPAAVWAPSEGGTQHPSDGSAPSAPALPPAVAGHQEVDSLRYGPWITDKTDSAKSAPVCSRSRRRFHFALPGARQHWQTAASLK